MLELQRLTGDHLEAVLAFELENRAYFARSVTDRGDEFYETYAERHRALLDEQGAGISVFFVLVEPDGSIVGRFNLYDLENDAAEVGYRVAERVAGHGVATEALSNLCRKAADDHGLQTLTAGTSTANVASQRVLEKAGFASTGTSVTGDEPGLEFTLSLAGVLPQGPRLSNHEDATETASWWSSRDTSSGLRLPKVARLSA
jgi:ribosomal-protein-alanine N-acetyltransferase